jgi:ribosomal protein S18 acetylase RimI-like enzyme
MNNIDLKKASPDDIEDLLRLERCVDGVKTYSAMTDKDEFLAELKDNNVFIIKNNDISVGSIMYEIKNPDHAYISGLVVDPHFQGRGIAREALIIILKELEHYRRIDLVTHPENFRATKLYESLGFSIESCKENYFGDGEPRVVMVKALRDKRG